MTIITISMLLVALPIRTNTIIHQQQQRQALAQANDINNKNNNSFRTYENPAYGIQIQYPSTWIIYAGDMFSDDDAIDIVSFLGPVKSDTKAHAPSLYISIVNPPPSPDLNLNLNEYLTRITNDYKAKLKEFKVIESNTNSILAGKPAYKLVFTDEEDEIYYKTMDIGTIIGDKVYLLSYEAEDEKQYSEYLPIIQKMIDSFKIIS
jgi:eukaryotic-like serine/threonine-protein kinase